MARVHLRHRVAVLDRARLRVQDDTNSYDVDIESGYCSCERPSLEGIICRHVWCVLLSNVDGGDAMRNNRLSLFAPKGGLKGELERLYEGQWVAAYIRPSIKSWRNLRASDLLPAPEPRLQGRPAAQNDAEQRPVRRNEQCIRSNDERREIRCSRCEGTGHNRRSCRTQPAQSPHES